MDPELLRMMSEAGLAGPENELLKAQYIESLKRRNTKQPGLIESRGMNVAASPLANVASTMSQIMGGQGANSLMEAMAGNLRKEQTGRSAIAGKAMEPGADPRRLQMLATGGGGATGSQATSLGQWANEQAQGERQAALIDSQNKRSELQYGEDRKNFERTILQQKQQHDENLKNQERMLKLTLGTQDKWSIQGDAMINERTGEVKPLPEGLKGKTPPNANKLTANEEQKAMFLDQAHKQLAQARAMGGDIFPNEGVSGIPENAGRLARSLGLPQMMSDKALARQGIMSAIAEPIVRAESGAAVPESEVKRLALRYIPVPGESRVEQERKLRSLVGAVGALTQAMPPWKAAEFTALQRDFQEWADALDSTKKKAKRIKLNADGSVTE
jgi:hypothetical protein